MFQTTEQFVTKWKVSSREETAGAHSHFLDLCELLGEPAPADAAGEQYGFEKPVGTARGGKGFADVWMRGHFAWEYQGRHKDLKRAYRQLHDYREELGNPPLLVTCDLERFEVHTNFAGTAERVYAFTLDELDRNEATAACPMAPMDVLRALFGDCDALRPERTDALATEGAAKLIGRLAERLEQRETGASREETARFLMRIVFCLFADAVGLLPGHLFRKMALSGDRFGRKLRPLFAAMSGQDGVFGEHTIGHFGGIFDSDAAIELNEDELGLLQEAARGYDWGHAAPATLGTLLERALDGRRRGETGARHTTEEEMRVLLEPVLARPLRRRWEEARAAVLEAQGENADEAARLLDEWLEELTQVRVLDPACGSGNFLVAALHELLALWLEAKELAAELGIAAAKMASPAQLLGIEKDFAAHGLAELSIWIAYLQWKHEHGFDLRRDGEPVLEKLKIEHGDAILRHDREGRLYEPAWPKADFLIGTLPMLSGERMRGELGDQYVSELLWTYHGRVGEEASLAAYWLSKALAEVQSGPVRVGVVAPREIREGTNRAVLARIAENASIFFAWSEREWAWEGGTVRASMIGFDHRAAEERELDGQPVNTITAELTSGSDVIGSMSLEENRNLAYQGPVKAGHFEVEAGTAGKMLSAPINANGQSNVRVVTPWITAEDLLDRPKGMYIIDFQGLSESEAAQYEMPFEYVRRHVYPMRQKSRRQRRRRYWWQHGKRNLAMRKALGPLERYIATPKISRHRFFRFVPAEALADSRVVVIARGDDYFMGLLESSIHRLWCTECEASESAGGDGAYNLETCFDPFPFPWAPGKEPAEAEDELVRAIATAARELMRLRVAWLNPPKASTEELRSRTLANLYTTRPDWLTHAHKALDEAVFAAYGWPADSGKDEILARLLALNHERAGDRGTGTRRATAGSLRE